MFSRRFLIRSALFFSKARAPADRYIDKASWRNLLRVILLVAYLIIIVCYQYGVFIKILVRMMLRLLWSCHCWVNVPRAALNRWLIQGCSTVRLDNMQSAEGVLASKEMQFDRAHLSASHKTQDAPLLLVSQRLPFHPGFLGCGYTCAQI